MQLLLRLSLFVAAGALLNPPLSRAETLTINLENIASSEGTIMVQVLPGEAGFAGDKPAAASFMRAARAGSMTFTAEDLAKGEYAFRVMHDENDNGKLDSNLIGMPTEPWAMSNNARGNFGPPKWKDVRFVVDGDVVQTVRLSK